MKISGSKAVIKILENEKVKFVFGIPGAATLSLYDALIDSPIKPILTAHESGASFMADAYSRVAGEVGVCITIPGPGFLNMLTPIAEAYHDSAPMIVIVANDQAHKKAFCIHECDHKSFVETISKSFFSVKTFSDIENMIPEAFLIAKSGEPGPVIIEVDTKLLDETGSINLNKNRDVETSLISANEKNTIDAIVNLLQKSSFVGIYAGRGAFGAADELLAIAEKLNAPVATTISGKGLISEEHELSVGFGFGPGSSKIARESFAKCDTVLAVGCKFSELSTGSYNIKVPKNLIHIDINSKTIGVNYKPTLALVMDSKQALSEILKCLSDDNIEYKKNNIDIKKIKSANCNRLNNSETHVHPLNFFIELRKQLKSDAILTTDVGNHNLWSIDSFQVLKPNTYIVPSNFQAMGFGIPAAIAAKLAFPERQVICVCGDGGFKMSSSELLTAKDEGLNPIIFVFKDNALGSIREIQKLKYGRVTAVNVINYDLEIYAKSIGIKYHKIDNDSRLELLIKNILNQNQLSIVEVNIQYSQLSSFMKGISIAKFKNELTSLNLNTISKGLLNKLKIVRARSLITF